ncbi:MAG: DNA polymerase I [Tepidisphaeraceae bacterium]
MPKTFYIIDGHAQIYRAYFAPFRDLTSPSGEPTKATYVFLQRLLKLIEDRKPDYLAMTIDGSDEELERRQIDPNYKANRQSPPADFKPQEQRILQIVRDLGIPIFHLPGHEADDVIATMAQQLKGGDFDTIIVSNDKDLRQLVDDHTRMYDIYADVFTDAAAIQSKFGYTPAQAIEIQTLIGDATDNVPGIPGIGEKTAAKLIGQYGSVAGVLAHLDELKPAVKRNLTENQHLLEQSRKLVTLRRDLVMNWDPQACKFNGVLDKALRPHLVNLGFHALLQRREALANEASAAAANTVKPAAGERFDEQLFGSAPSTTTQEIHYETAADCSYTIVRSHAEFADFLAELKRQGRFAFDTETDALGARASKLVGMSFSWQPRRGFYVPVRGPTGSVHLAPEEVLRLIKPILEDANIKKVGHNIKYDISVMRQAGIEVRGVALDSMIAAFLLDAGRMQYGIDRLALDLLQFRKIPTSDLIGKGVHSISMAQVDIEKVGTYAAEDADIAWRLAEMFEGKLREVPQLLALADDLETPLIEVLSEMEFNGIAVDPSILREQSMVLGERVEELRQKICEAAGVEFNCDSPKQLAEILYQRLKLPVPKRNKTGPSTDVEALDKISHLHPAPKLVQDYRALVKLKNTYLDKLTDYVNPATGRIHASFNQIGAETGRLSCSEPNLQNIPIRSDEGRRIRLAFVPGDRERNVLLTADYSQIELRLLAHFTREPALMRAFENDEDVHRAVAAEVFGVRLEDVTKDQRAQAKVINFGIIYGVSAYGLSWRIEGLTVQSADALIKAYHQRFPSIAKFFQKCVMDAQAKGYVETILGRRRPIPDISSGVLNLRNQGERQAINSVVQGSAADLIKRAMLNVHRRLKAENHPSKMLLQVHDELVFETPSDLVKEEAEMVRQEMVGAMKLAVPLRVDVGWGKNWQEVK